LKRGHPTTFEQENIIRDIMPYYQKGISARATANHTGHNIKTVLKYFKQWDKNITEQEDFIQRTKTTKEKAISSIDDEIISLNNHEKEIDIVRKRAYQSGNVLHFEKMSRLSLKLSDQRLKAVAAKTNLINTPTADIITKMERDNG